MLLGNKLMRKNCTYSNFRYFIDVGVDLINRRFAGFYTKIELDSVFISSKNSLRYKYTYLLRYRF